MRRLKYIDTYTKNRQPSEYWMTEFLIQMEMYNDLGDKIFVFLLNGMDSHIILQNSN